jgi:hypothetical protein
VSGHLFSLITFLLEGGVSCIFVSAAITLYPTFYHNQNQEAVLESQTNEGTFSFYLCSISFHLANATIDLSL